MVDAMTFDFDAVTPRMLVEFKRETGVELMSLVGEGGLNMAAMPSEAIAGVVWLALRMSGKPDATFDEALDIPFSSLTFAEDPEPDPTHAS